MSVVPNKQLNSKKSIQERVCIYIHTRTHTNTHKSNMSKQASNQASKCIRFLFVSNKWMRKRKNGEKRKQARWTLLVNNTLHAASTRGMSRVLQSDVPKTKTQTKKKTDSDQKRKVKSSAPRWCSCCVFVEREQQVERKIIRWRDVCVCVCVAFVIVECIFGMMESKKSSLAVRPAVLCMWMMQRSQSLDVVGNGAEEQKWSK